MKFLIDTHCHTISSGHAYSTVIEIAKEAHNKGLEIVGITDHGPDMPGGPNVFHIFNQKVIPEKIYGVTILRGVEANIIDYNGKLDVSDEILSTLDVVIASLHNVCLNPGTKEENTQALLKTMKNKYVDIIGHPGNPIFPIDYETFVKGAKETSTLIEINNSSFLSSRVGSLENCIHVAKLCKENGVEIIVGSDSHIAFDVGRCEKAMEVLQKVEMPPNLIMNLSPEKFINYLKTKEKIRFLDSESTPKI